MSSADSWLRIIAVVFAILGFLAVGVGYYKAKVTEAQLDALRGDRDDLKQRVDRLEGDKTRLEGENNTLISRVQVLESLVSPNEAINTLVAALKVHDDNVAERYKKNDRTLADIMGHVDQILNHLEKP